MLGNLNSKECNGHARLLNIVCAGGDAPTLEQISRSIHRRWPLTSITAAESGVAALEIVKVSPPDLVLVHADLRGMFVQVLVEEIRSLSSVPIMVLARDRDDSEAVAALELGADDYFQYPCGLWTFIARVWAVLRRAGLMASGEATGCFLISGRLFIDPLGYEAYLDDRKVHLTPAEFRLLYLLAKNHGEVVTHQALEQQINGGNPLNVPSAKKYIQRLRWKLDDNAGSPGWIASVYGVGYRFVGPRPRWQGPLLSN